jgi:hypothetical protein
MNPIALGASIAFCMLFGALAVMSFSEAMSDDTRVDVVVPIRIPHPVLVERR